MRECQGSRLAHCYEAGWLDAFWRCLGYDGELAAEFFSPNKLFYACLHEAFGRTEKRAEYKLNPFHDFAFISYFHQNKSTVSQIRSNKLVVSLRVSSRLLILICQRWRGPEAVKVMAAQCMKWVPPVLNWEVPQKSQKNNWPWTAIPLSTSLHLNFRFLCWKKDIGFLVFFFSPVYFVREWQGSSNFQANSPSLQTQWDFIRFVFIALLRFVAEVLSLNLGLRRWIGKY